MSEYCLVLNPCFFSQADIKGIPSNLQPLAITLLKEGGYNYDNQPVKLVAGVPDSSRSLASQFCAAWATWCNTMLPKSCTFKPGKPKRNSPKTFSEWNVIARGGRDGMSLVLMSLMYWFNTLDEDVDSNEKDSDHYTEAVELMIWIMEVVIDGAERGKLSWTAEEEMVVGKRGSKRTSTEGGQLTAEGSLRK